MRKKLLTFYYEKTKQKNWRVRLFLSLKGLNVIFFGPHKKQRRLLL